MESSRKVWCTLPALHREIEMLAPSLRLCVYMVPLSRFSASLLLLSIAKSLNSENNYCISMFPPTESKVTNQTWWINHCSFQTPGYIKWYWGKKGEGAIYIPFSFKNGISLVVWRMETYYLFESHSLKHFWKCFHIESQLSLTQEMLSLSIVVAGKQGIHNTLTELKLASYGKCCLILCCFYPFFFL